MWFFEPRLPSFQNHKPNKLLLFINYAVGWQSVTVAENGSPLIVLLGTDEIENHPCL
jgi:hypothetical protein